MKTSGKAKSSFRDKETEISDALQVEKEISEAQVAIAGEGTGISHELISLEVTSPHVPDLTLIDLPGITRIAVGNQLADIEYQIKSLIRKYILKQETINLVLVPANVDIATVEALRRLRRWTSKDRTIGILTKPDLVDKSTEDKVVDVVRNLVFHLKKGYMIVKCRGQQDIQHQLSLTKALQKEQDFFGNHAHFRDLLEEGRATVPCLAERLTTELIMHVCKSLPLLENQIKESHQRITEELQKCGSDIPEDASGKMFSLIDKIDAFNKEISNIIEGEEFVGKYDSRLFNKMRTEFYRWSIVVANSFQKGGQHPHLQPHPLDHPVLHAQDVRPAAERHAAAAAEQGRVRQAAEGAQRHQRQEEAPEGAAAAADPGSARQVPRLNPPSAPPRGLQGAGDRHLSLPASRH